MAPGLALEGGYYGAVTFTCVPADVRAKARTGMERGIETILATQISENGKRTIWAQQHDALTLKPDAGRNYEPAEWFCARLRFMTSHTSAMQP